MADEKFQLLTDMEAAELLRCSWRRIARLRLTGELPYLPGLPPLILKRDLEAYMLRKLTAQRRASEGPSAAERARTKWLKRHFANRRKLAAQQQPKDKK